MSSLTKFLAGQISRYQLTTEKMANPVSAVYTYFMDSLSGSVERITYYNSENGYTVLRLRPEVSRGLRIPGLSYDGLATVVGNLP